MLLKEHLKSDVIKNMIKYKLLFFFYLMDLPLSTSPLPVSRVTRSH